MLEPVSHINDADPAFAYGVGLPKFESEWVPNLGMSVPTNWTDNAWRAAQTAVRAKWGLPALPTYPTPQAGDIFCSPNISQTVGETGNGSQATPYIIVNSCKVGANGGPAANAPGKRVWVETGKFIEDDSMSLSATSSFLQLAAAQAGTEWRAWFRNPSVRTPCVIRRLKAYGANAVDWEEVDMKTGSPGNTLIATAGVYTPLPGSGYWHLKTPATFTATPIMVGLGKRDSILDQVDIDSVAAFKNHGWDAGHVFRNAMTDGSAGTARVPTTNNAPLDNHLQWTWTPNGGFVLYVNPAVLLLGQSGNPGSLFGGVFIALQFHNGVTLLGSDILCDHPFAFEYCGIGARMNVNAGDTMSNSVYYGVQTRMCGLPYYIASTSNLSPVSGVHNGSVHMGAAGNEGAPFGDGTEPWLENCRFERVRAVASQANIARTGWIRGVKEFDIRTHASRLQGAGAGGNFASKMNCFEYAEFCEEMYHYHSLLDSGVGEFAGSDGGEDDNGSSALMRRHHGRVYVSLFAAQVNGGGRGCMNYMMDYVDVHQGMDATDSVYDGTGETQYDHCRCVLSRSSDWATARALPAKFGPGQQFGIRVGREVNMQPRGPLGDNETRTHNIGPARFRNCEVDKGTSEGAYAWINETHTAGVHGSPIVGAWRDAGGGLAPNGLAVPPGQTQSSQLYLPPADGLTLVGFDTSHRFVDLALAPDPFQQAVVQRLTTLDASVRNADGTLQAGAPSAVREGNTFLDAVMEGPVTPWLQPGASLFDILGNPSTNDAETSVGPYYYRGSADVQSRRLRRGRMPGGATRRFGSSSAA